MIPDPGVFATRSDNFVGSISFVFVPLRHCVVLIRLANLHIHELFNIRMLFRFTVERIMGRESSG